MAKKKEKTPKGTNKKPSKNIVMYFSMFGKNEKIADIISLHFNAFKLCLGTSGKGLLKIPLHFIMGLLEKDIVMFPGKNLKDYKTIFIGGPVWGERPCPALTDIIKKANIKGKNVIVFLTAKSSFGKAPDIVRKAIEARGAVPKAVLEFFTSESEEKIKKKLKDSGIELA